MVMDTLAGIAFSYEPPLKEYMKEKPKKKDENIMNYMICMVKYYSQVFIQHYFVFFF